MSNASALVRRARTSRVIRLGLKAAIFPLPFKRIRGADPFLFEARCARLDFVRFAVDRRRPLRAFECLAKTVG